MAAGRSTMHLCPAPHPRTLDAMGFERERTRSWVDRKVGVDL